MPAEITMPQLSDTMSEGTLVKWHKKVGDKVGAGEEIADVETDKATMPMEAFESGTLAVQLAKEGDKIKVGDLLGVIAVSGEKAEDLQKQYAAGGAAAGRKKVEGSAAGSAGGTPQAENVQKAGTGAASVTTVTEDEGGGDGASSHDTELGRGPLEVGRAQSRRELVHEGPERTSESMSRDASALIGKAHATGGKMLATSRGASGGNGHGRLRVSPLARRIAEEKGIDLSQVQGSGPNGRIVQRDVEDFSPRARRPAGAGGGAAAAGKPARKGPPPVSLAPKIPAGEQLKIAHTKMRTVIAQRLQQSKQQIPHFYESIDIDTENLAQLRAQMNRALEAEGIRLSIADLIAKGVSHALLMHPALNAHYLKDEVVRFGDVNLGMAVALPDGLIVPVLRGINRLGLREIRQGTDDLVDRARKQNLKQNEMTGATFTVSNLGTYGIREFSAIINPPEVGILAIGTADQRAVVRNGQIVARSMMTVTLSADHRAVDGATAAEFLQSLRMLLEEPGMMLV